MALRKSRISNREVAYACASRQLYRQQRPLRRNGPNGRCCLNVPRRQTVKWQNFSHTGQRLHPARRSPRTAEATCCGCRVAAEKSGSELNEACLGPHHSDAKLLYVMLFNLRKSDPQVPDLCVQVDGVQGLLCNDIWLLWRMVGAFSPKGCQRHTGRHCPVGRNRLLGLRRGRRGHLC